MWNCIRTNARDEVEVPMTHWKSGSGSGSGSGDFGMRMFAKKRINRGYQRFPWDCEINRSYDDNICSNGWHDKASASRTPGSRLRHAAEPPYDPPFFHGFSECIAGLLLVQMMDPFLRDPNGNSTSSPRANATATSSRR